MTVQHGEQAAPLLADDNHDGRETPESFDYSRLQAMTAQRKQVLFRLLAIAHPAHLVTLGKRFGYALVPSPIRSLVWDDHAPAPKQFPTSYLNGLRGITAIKVFTFHYWMAYTNFTHQPWNMDQRCNNFMIFPIFRYFWTGFTSQVFFGIAGYLTCLRLFQLLDKDDAATQAKIFFSIASSLFRRGFRLYLPVALVMLIMALYIHTGLYETSRPFIMEAKFFPGWWFEPKPRLYPTLYEQLIFWRTEVIQITDVTNPATIYFLHDQHLWSILAEMRASIHLYVCLIMFAGCKRNIRLIGLCIMTVVFFIWNKWETWVYTIGAIVAQVDIILTERQRERDQPQLPTATEVEKEKAEEQRTGSSFLSISMPTMDAYNRSVAATKTHVRSATGIAFRWVGFLVAFYFLSFPINAPTFYAPGYETMKLFIPEWVDRKDKVYPNIGTGILLILLARSDPKRSKWRRVLMSRIPQYLGTISFAMYLVHGPLLHMFGYMIPHRIWWANGVQGSEVGNAAWMGAIMVGYSFTLVVAWAAADVWTREVENRMIRCVKTLETWCFKSKSA